jgi:N-acetyl-gamma-glutamylphosphate reductase
MQHKHLPEMQTHGLLDRPPVFSPTVGNFLRGMLVTVPLHTGTFRAAVPARNCTPSTSSTSPTRSSSPCAR